MTATEMNRLANDSLAKKVENIDKRFVNYIDRLVKDEAIKGKHTLRLNYYGVAESVYGRSNKYDCPDLKTTIAYYRNQGFYSYEDQVMALNGNYNTVFGLEW